MTERLEDLSARARRQALSESEKAELTSLLAADPDERLWHGVGLAFDAEDKAEPEDAAANARVLERLRAPAVAKVVPLRRKYGVWLVAAATVLVVGVAVAARWSSKPAPPVAPARAPTANHTLAPRLAPAPAPLEAASVSAVASASVSLRSAAELASDAGRARRAGNSSQAAALLESLQTRYPGSPEALASEITLGSLKLQSGSAPAALQHFNRYLARAPGGSLAAEALWGRAQALSRLGNEVEAKKALGELVQRFPASPYTSAANAKLRARGSH